MPHGAGDHVDPPDGRADRRRHPVRRLRRHRQRRRGRRAQAASRAVPARRRAPGRRRRPTRSRSRTRSSGCRPPWPPAPRPSASRIIVPLPESDEHTLWAIARRPHGRRHRRRGCSTGGRTMNVDRRSSGPFRVGDRVQLTGPKGRLNTITLEPGELFHTPPRRARPRRRHRPAGRLGRRPTTRASNYLALRPLLNDFVMSMPRGAAIIYPKDAAQILALADIFPGATVVEAGVGSGALSLWLLRAIGEERPAALVRAPRRVRRRRAGERRDLPRRRPGNWTVTVGDLQDALPAAAEPASVDRVVLDMLAPWETPRRGDRGAHARRSRALLRRHGHAALAGRRGDPGDRALHAAPVERDDGARLARRGPRRAARPPHDRAHRLPDHRPAPRARHGARPSSSAARRRATTTTTTSSLDARRARRAAVRARRACASGMPEATASAERPRCTESRPSPAPERRRR